MLLIRESNKNLKEFFQIKTHTKKEHSVTQFLEKKAAKTEPF